MTEAAARSLPAAPPSATVIWLVYAIAALLLLLHLGFTLAPFTQQDELTWNFALMPMRFWAPAGSADVYPDYLSGLLTLLSSGLLHGDWMHVIVNAAMLVWFGVPVARALGRGAAAWGYWILLFVGSVIAGSALYLALTDASAAYLIGASGGTSGIIAAAMLLGDGSGRRALWSVGFLVPTAIFAAMNVALVLAAPYALGMAVSWEAHAGGYVFGALLTAVLPLRGHGSARS
jgi:membrane associated rhomboid family serine protease